MGDAEGMPSVTLGVTQRRTPGIMPGLMPSCSAGFDARCHARGYPGVDAKSDVSMIPGWTPEVIWE